MKAAISVGLWLAGLLAAGAQSPLSRLELVSANSREYVRLEDWTRANGYQLQWTTPKKEIAVTAGTVKLRFTVDSNKININGVNLWISSPICLGQNCALIEPVDLTATVHPLLFPPRTSTGRGIRTICLDPGHGGKDPGNQEGRQQEKKYALLLAKELDARLRKAGFKVIHTRSSDSFVELDDRADYARRRGADLFLSLHYNAANTSSVRGVEVYCMTPARTSSTNARGEGASTGQRTGNRYDANNVLLAYRLQKWLVKYAGLEDRGVRRARFAVLRDAAMPAVLIEAGFMSNPQEAKKIYDAEQRKQVAQAIADGVVAYKRTVDRTVTVAKSP